MRSHDVLLIYYSRTGTTQKTAELLSKSLSCDVERIEEKNRRSGVLGYVRSAFEALAHTAPEIEPGGKDPARYRAVILAGPVWAGQVASPLRTYVLQNAKLFKNVAFLLTCGGSGSDRVFTQMRGLCGKTPIAELALTAQDIGKGRQQKKLEELGHEISAALRKSVRPAAAELKPGMTG